MYCDAELRRQLCFNKEYDDDDDDDDDVDLYKMWRRQLQQLEWLSWHRIYTLLTYTIMRLCLCIYEHNNEPVSARSAINRYFIETTIKRRDLICPDISLRPIRIQVLLDTFDLWT